MPSITDQYVALAERIALRLGSPRVSALHLPPPEGAAVKHVAFYARQDYPRIVRLLENIG